MKQLSDATVSDFKGKFRGDVVLPGGAGYDEARQIWNAMIDRKPALIARVQIGGGCRPGGRFRARQRACDLD